MYNVSYDESLYDITEPIFRKILIYELQDMSEKGKMVNSHKLCILICCIYHAQEKKKWANAKIVTQIYVYNLVVNTMGEI